MSRPDLNLLVALDVLLAEGSVARAARRLRLSPSAMSRALARLRETTGDPLLVRAGRGPTPRAIELRERVSQLVQDGEAVFPALADRRLSDHAFSMSQIPGRPGPGTVPKYVRPTRPLPLEFRRELVVVRAAFMQAQGSGWRRGQTKLRSASPGGIHTYWKAPPWHGAHPLRTSPPRGSGFGLSSNCAEVRHRDAAE